MEKQDIINYVLKTPENTNPAILGHLIDEISSGGTEPTDGFMGLQSVDIDINIGTEYELTELNLQWIIFDPEDEYRHQILSGYYPNDSFTKITVPFLNEHATEIYLDGVCQQGTVAIGEGTVIHGIVKFDDYDMFYYIDSTGEGSIDVAWALQD